LDFPHAARRAFQIDVKHASQVFSTVGKNLIASTSKATTRHISMNSDLGPALKRTFLFLLGALLCASHADAADGHAIQIGTRHTIASKIMGEARPYLVHTPSGYDLTGEVYPLVILLDGDAHFQHVVASADFLSERNRIPGLIVVGVSNTVRTRDLTPPTSTSGDVPPSIPTGGAEKFLGFIGDELIPELERRYRVRPYRILIGHSYGGLFTLYSLLNRPELFDSYIAISPSLFWNDRALVNATGPFLASHRELRANLFLTAGDEDTDLLGSCWQLAGELELSVPYQEQNKPRLLRWEFRHLRGETHGSTPMLSVYEGLEATFDGWWIQDPFRLFSLGGLAGLERHYAELSERMGYAVPIPQSTLLSVAQTLTERNRMTEAIATLSRTSDLYPNSWQVHFALARIYETMKDEERAIEQLKQTILINPGFEMARQMLTDRRVDVSSVVAIPTLPRSLLRQFVGKYRVSDLSVEITLQGDKLYAVDEWGKREIRPKSDDTFYYFDVDKQITFQRTANGRVSSIAMRSGSQEYILARVR
jgi:predicted alpha/beta superfamily hydrolase